MSSGDQQELKSYRISVGHLPAFQIFFLHKIFSDEIPGLPKDEVIHPRIYCSHVKNFPGSVFGGTVALHEDHTQDKYQDARFGQAPFTVLYPIIGEAQFDEEAVAMIGMIHFHQIKAKEHLHAFRGSQEDLKEVDFTLVDDNIQCICLCYQLFHLILKQQEIHQQIHFLI